MDTNKAKVGGITEVAKALGTEPGRLTRMKQHGEFIEPIGTVSGRDAYDMRAAERWAKSHQAQLGNAATRMATRTTGATRTARAASGRTTGTGRGRASRSNPYR